VTDESLKNVITDFGEAIAAHHKSGGKKIILAAAPFSVGAYY